MICGSGYHLCLYFAKSQLKPSRNKKDRIFFKLHQKKSKTLLWPLYSFFKIKVFSPTHNSPQWGQIFLVKLHLNFYTLFDLTRNFQFEFECNFIKIFCPMVKNDNYRIVASRNTCYHSENKVFCFLKSRVVSWHKFF